MRQSSNHRRGTGRNHNTKLNINSDLLQAALRLRTIERIAGFQAKINELRANQAPESMIDVIEQAMNRAQATL